MRLRFQKSFWILFKQYLNKQLYSCVTASMSGGRELTICRYDFQEWEYNKRTGCVEVNYCLDASNTLYLSEILGATSTCNLFDLLKSRFRYKNECIHFTESFTKFCDKNGIEYSYNVWY